MNTSTKTKTSTMPLKQKANAKCACNSGKKYKKCCKKKVMAEKQTIYKIPMNDFRYWLLANGREETGNWNANPNTNKNINGSIQVACDMIERYKDPTFYSSHPKYLDHMNILKFCIARKGKLHNLQNHEQGWYSHCFQNAYFYAKYKGGKPKIGWLLTQTKPNVKHTQMKDAMSQKTLAHAEGEDLSFAAELHLIVEFEDGTLYDPTPDYDPTIDEKIWVNDPQLQHMVDSVEGKGFGPYTQMIGAIQDWTPGRSGFLHKHNMKEWRCPMMLMGF